MESETDTQWADRTEWYRQEMERVADAWLAGEIPEPMVRAKVLALREVDRQLRDSRGEPAEQPAELPADWQKK